MKNAILYNIVINADMPTLKIQRCLHYSLHTLFTHNPDPSFDVVVGVQGPDYIKSQLIKRFPKIIIKDIEYDFEKNLQSHTMSKWYSIASCSEYDKVIFLDCDTIHNRPCEYIFKKYNQHDFYGVIDPYTMPDGSTIFFAFDSHLKGLGRQLDYTRDISGFKSINSGQMMLSNKAIKVIAENINELPKNLKMFLDRLDRLLDPGFSDAGALMGIKWITEQPSGYKILLDRQIEVVEFDYNDVYFNVNPEKWHSPTILHYIGTFNIDLILPKEYGMDLEGHNLYFGP